MMITHGMWQSPEYRTWSSMKNRCTNPSNNKFANYGKRGIGFCKRWERFESFYADMGKRPHDKHSLDRIDNDGNYEPGNCRWATWDEQNRNRRVQKRNKSGVTGVFLLPNNRWRASIKVHGRSIHLYSGKDFQTAIKARRKGEELYW